MGRLPMLWKVVAVSAVLLVPAVVVGQGYRDGIGAQTSFAAAERAGIDSASPLLGLIAATVELRTANVRLALGDTAASTRAQAATEALATTSKKLDGVVDGGAGGIDVEAQWKDARAAVAAFAAREAGSDPATELAAADAALAKLNAALVQVLGDSNLILDPDLDSYSVMDAWLLRMPIVLDLATRSAATVEIAARKGATADVPTMVALAAAQARLEDALAATGADVAGITAATSDEAAAATSAAKLAPLDRTLGKLHATLARATGDGRLPANALAQGDAVAAAATSFGGASATVLDRLLVSRTSRLDGSLHRDVLVALLCLLVGLYLVAAIVRQVRGAIEPIEHRLGMLEQHCTTDLRTGLERVAQGDLTFEVVPVTPLIDEISRDELGRIATAVNGIRERTVASVVAYNDSRGNLAGLIGRVQEASTTVSSASAQMATTSDEAGRAVGEIAHAVGDVAAGAEKQVRVVEQARATAEATGQSATEARSVVDEGVDAAARATQAMEAVRDSTQSVTEAISGLSAKSEQIGGIVETITSIASQTNLLALNAAIEAARAGEQGRGFAVVAEEVRKLAEESQGAATEIAGLIAEIQTETQKTVGVVEDGVKLTEAGVEVVAETRVAFEQIDQRVAEIVRQVAEIVTATSDVAAVAEQASASTEEVSASTEQTSASAQQIAASAQHLAARADELQELVATFTVAA
ncbi:MAG: HAMP domain-containing methyl-accepting chemotaxis protein [Gaiellales bacterium]